MTGKLSLQRVQAFVAISDHRGISAAARALGVAQSTVSSHLQQLEGEVGAVLVDRSAPSLRLTEAGEKLLEYGRSLLALADETLDQVARVRRAPVAGVLAIGGTTTATERLLPRLLRSFLDRYPDVELELHVANSSLITQKVLSGELPLALVAAQSEQPSLNATAAGCEEQVVIVAGDHPLAGQQVEPRLLRGTRMLLREEGSTTRQYQVDMAQRWGIPRTQASTIASTSAIVAAVAQGLGLACLPRAVAEEALLLGRVAEVHLDPAPPARPIQLIRLAARPLALVEELFIESVREERTS
ncbi:LysR family transcriptional regulator [Nonomuraea guangzhouensis]|uniref:LysR family transcriptional regulator n=1 Tax=Nonomuraea guangzhouensis TaxID=1291555 RepID=A0ABW4GYZ6_9ACTN|nr:LysR family transcriptional regulator [Nonomuraea guangzhouensis]